MIKGIPLELCRQEGVEFCRLRYDPGWAAIEGSLTDNRCGVITSVRGATVELRELEPEEPFAPRVRYVLSRMGGQYLIRGVVPGERYALRVSRPSATPTEHFLEHHDTLTFTPGQRMQYDVALQRAACP